MLSENLTDYLALGFAVLALILMSVQTARMWKKYRFRFFLSFSWGLLLLFIFCGLLCIKYAESAARNNIREMLSDLAKSISIGIEKLGHEKLTLDTPLDDERYLFIMSTMKEWMRKVPTIASLYTMRLDDDGHLIFIAEPGSDLNRNGQFDEGEEDHPIGNPYDEPLEDVPEIADAFQGKSGFNGVPMEDVYGFWITAAEPLYDADGNIDAILGVDFWAESWMKEIQDSKFWPTLFYLLFLTLFFVVQFFLQRHFLTEEKLSRYASDLEKTVKNLVEANRQADMAIRAKGNFLTNMSHEIRTPMNAVFGFVEILTRKLMIRCLPEERAECQETVSLLMRSGNQLLTIINDILDFSQAEDHKLQLKDVPFSISKIVGEVEDIMRERIKDKPSLRISFKGDGRVPERIRSDPERIRQIMSHLVGNAIKFTESGSIRVRYGILMNKSLHKTIGSVSQSATISNLTAINMTALNLINEGSSATTTNLATAASMVLAANSASATSLATEKIIAENELKAKSAEKIFYFSVKDTGIGIAKENLSDLFEPFSQVDSSLTRRFGGTGLGLAICRRLALLLGGNLTVTSRLNHGSVFRLTFPIEECDAKVESTSNSKFLLPIEVVGSSSNRVDLNETTDSGKNMDIEENAEQKISVVQALANYRILVVEDGHINQIVISSQLKEAGAEVALAENGQVALDAVAASEEEERPFDAILMDMQMPVMDGYEATSKLRERGYTRPIIALTAHTLSGDCEKTLAAGCDAYMSKPIAFQKLISLIVSRKRR